MTFSFAGKVALITGGAGGIGLALANRFARERMKIVLADLEEPALSKAAAAIEAEGSEVLAVPTDVSSATAIEHLAQKAYARFGAVHLLCNNAGVAPAGRAQPVWEYAPEDWRWAFDVNVMGVVHGLRSFVPRMIASGERGHIVNTASIAGLISGARSVVYSTSKHAVVRVSEALYASLQDGGHPIGTTVLCPGLVDTAIYRSERNRPQQLVPAGGVVADSAELVDAAAAGIAPAVVADMLCEAVDRGQFYLLTTDDYDDMIRARGDALLERRNPRFTDVFTVGSSAAAPAGATQT